jgi:hypothetical protein
MSQTQQGCFGEPQEEPRAKRYDVLDNTTKKTILFFYDTDEDNDEDGDPAEAYWSPIEKRAWRGIGAPIEAHFRRLGYNVVDYTLYEDLEEHVPFPDYAVAVFMCHCWPTVHDFPAQLSEMLALTLRPCVPSAQQMAFVLRKTDYVAQILQSGRDGVHNVRMLPTRVVRQDDDLDEVAA